MSERALPHSEEAERALLGAVLLRPEVLDIAGGLVTDPEVFYFERHRAIWSSMLALRGAGSPIDERTIQAHLQQRGEFEKAGGLAYLAALDLDLPLSGIERVQDYCSILIDRWARRRAVAVAVELRELAVSGESADVMIEQTASALEAIQRDRAPKADAASLLDLVESYDPAAESDDSWIIPTGLPDLDRIIGGFEPGQLVVIGGRPSHGKTALATQVSRSAASALCRVRIQSLEMRADEIRSRMLCQGSGVEYSRIHRHQLTPAEQRTVAGAKAMLVRDVRDRLMIDDRPRLTLGQMGAACSVDQLRRGLHLVMIDHSGLIGWSGREPPIREKVGQITAECKALAKSLDVVVVLFHHLSRQHEADKRSPTMRDLIESQAVERDADIVLLVWRPELSMAPDDEGFDEARGVGYVIVAKQRNGPRERVKFHFDAPRMLFRGLAAEPPF